MIDSILQDHDIPLPDPAAPDRPSLKGRVKDQFNDCGDGFWKGFNPPLEGGSKSASADFGEGYVVTFPSRLRRENLKTVFAGRLREDMTDAERCLWAILRSQQVAGLRFRRQQPIGPYIVDFFCPSAKLVIELDGDQHDADDAVLYDDARTRWLVQRGYAVLRFPNADVFRNGQVIIDAIVHHLEEYDVPLPEKSALRADFSTLPQGEGERSLKGRVEN